MSGRTAAERTVVPSRSAGRQARSAAPTAEPLARLGLDLVLFVLLGAFAVGQWAHLFADPPVSELAAALAVATAGGLAMAAVGRARAVPGRVTGIVVIAATTVVLALVVSGLPARLLAPGNWDELGANLDAGLSGIQHADLPYDGRDVWTRLTLLLGAPLLLGLAAVLTFWPVARSLTRVGGLAALLAIYGIAVTLDSPGSELLWGVPLLILCVAWLWLPAAPWRQGAVVVACGVLAGGLALPLATTLDAERPWWDYESWNWFSEERVSFDWNHTYGPLDWPQKGTTLLEVRSEQPLYWKTSVLDRFDGFTWQRADPGDPLAAGEVNARATAADAVALSEANPEWLLGAQFDVRNLESDFVVGAGTPLVIEGHGAAQRMSDGTVLAGDDPLDSGEGYSIVTYSPQPSPNRMRRAPGTYPDSVAAGSTLVGLPADSPSVGPSGFGSAPAIAVPAWGSVRDETTRTIAERRGQAIATSAYGDMYSLARNLTRDEPTAYDAVHAVEEHLRDNYDYTQNVPNRTYPLNSFLFEDFAGYCQQFSGAMALMLRMVGIPARVVSGFAPGRYVAEDDLYEVSDTDAHSWVEVYFTGIGWVAFDPTPSAAPANAQLLEEGGPLVLRRDGGAAEQSRGLAQSIEEALEGGRAPRAAPAGEGGSPFAAILVVGVVGVALWFGAGYLRRRARLHGPRADELQARELTAALARLGWQIPAGVTLHAIERRFTASGRSPIASYARALGRYRYEPGPARLPGPAERRSLRRALGRGGPRRRWRALRALPPGGPRVGT